MNKLTLGIVFKKLLVTLLLFLTTSNSFAYTTKECQERLDFLTNRQNQLIESSRRTLVGFSSVLKHPRKNEILSLLAEGANKKLNSVPSKTLEQMKIWKPKDNGIHEAYQAKADMGDIFWYREIGGDSWENFMYRDFLHPDYKNWQKPIDHKDYLRNKKRFSQEHLFESMGVSEVTCQKGKEKFKVKAGIDCISNGALEFSSVETMIMHDTYSSEGIFAESGDFILNVCASIYTLQKQGERMWNQHKYNVTHDPRACFAIDLTKREIGKKVTVTEVEDFIIKMGDPVLTAHHSYVDDQLDFECKKILGWGKKTSMESNGPVNLSECELDQERKSIICPDGATFILSKSANESSRQIIDKVSDDIEKQPTQSKPTEVITK